jgi:glycosyltransferase involved in cell wall biosynthesis
MTDALPMLSICVPTFNRPERLANALRSIIAAGALIGGGAGPTTTDVEIVVSDNSPDVTEGVARDALRGWPGASRYVPNRPDIGMVANFNQCVSLASGRYVLLVHDDDSLLPGAIPAILAAIDGLRPDGPPLLFGVHVIDDVGGTRRRQEFSANTDLGPRAALRRVLSDSSFVRFPAIVVPRAAYEAAGPFDPAMSNAVDLDMWVRLFARHGLRCVPATISVYTVHAEASTASMFNRGSIETLMRIFERARATGLLPDAAIRRCQADFFHQFILGGAYRSLRAGDARAARDVMALFGDPQVKALGMSSHWLPIRAMLSGMVWIPGPIARGAIGMIERFNIAQHMLTAR